MITLYCVRSIQVFFFFFLVNFIESNKGQFDTEHNWVVYLDSEPNTSANRKYMWIINYGLNWVFKSEWCVSECVYVCFCLFMYSLYSGVHWDCSKQALLY